MRIALLTGNSLGFNPRAWKEAEALADAGHDVTILGAWLNASLKSRDLVILENAKFAFLPVSDVTQTGPRLRHFFDRAAGVLARHLCGLTGLESRHQLGITVGALARAARHCDAELYIAHSEAGLFAARQLSRRGKLVGVDMEDWFSEDLLAEARHYRPLKLLKKLERAALNAGWHATCPSRAMRDALVAAYDCPPPAVVYNSFPPTDIDGRRKDRRDAAIPSLHWFSQTLGPGRGLEELAAALPHVRHAAEIHLRGNLAHGFDRWLLAQLPAASRQRVFFHGLVPNAELPSRIAEHDIGFAGEMKYCLSRDLTVTNKILQYLQAGLAVAASDTKGQVEVAEQAPGAVFLYRAGDPAALADQLNLLLASPERLRQAKKAASAVGESLSWDRQKKTLLNAINAVEARRRAAEIRIGR